MILRPQVQDLKIILFLLGKVLIAFGAMMVIPLVVGFFWGEISPVIDFGIGVAVSLIAGYGLVVFARIKSEPPIYWAHGMVVVALAWVICMILGAIPLFLSGHWRSFLDACFESMSALATTGLTLAQDLDHLSHAANLWRHFMMFLGGQGIIVAALTFFGKSSGMFRLYVGEARDERILPNVVETARFIWQVSLIYLGIGTALLTFCGVIWVGMSWQEAVFHGACNFMAAFDTGGFMPQSQNIIYYQSVVYEAATIICMIWGSINFHLHYAIWKGKRRELWQDIEIRTFAFSLLFFGGLLLLGLAKSQVYDTPMALFRRGAFQFISGHTGTGFQSIYSGQFVTDWSSLSMAILILVMGLGVSACSTTGGIKMLRLGIVVKAVREDIKRFLTSESAMILTRFRHLRDVFLDDRMVRSAALVTLIYCLLYLVGALVGCFYQYPFTEALFESVSAGGNVGLSCGVTSAAMPAVLKWVYIVQMWLGRLEFLSVFVLVGFFVAYVRGR